MDEHLHAAPPDDGGERGSFTVPEDALAASDDGGRSPALHRAGVHDLRGTTAGGWSVAVVALLVLVAALLFGVYAP